MTTNFLDAFILSSSLIITPPTLSNVTHSEFVRDSTQVAVNCTLDSKASGDSIRDYVNWFIKEDSDRINKEILATLKEGTLKPEQLPHLLTIIESDDDSEFLREILFILENPDNKTMNREDLLNKVKNRLFILAPSI